MAHTKKLRETVLSFKNLHKITKAEFIEALSQDNLKTGQKLETLNRFLWESASGRSTKGIRDKNHREAGELFDEILEDRIRKILYKLDKESNEKD